MSTPAVGQPGTLVWRLTPGKPATTQLDGLHDIDEVRRQLAALHPEIIEALHEHGALYIRGLPVRSVDDFAKVRDVLIPSSTPYRERRHHAATTGTGSSRPLTFRRRKS